jgi:hypothetical protein
MSEAKRDTQRAVTAAKAILDDRDPANYATIMVTTEHAVATVLLALFRDPAKAAAMLNEGLVPGIETRLSMMMAKHESGQ